MFRLITEHLQSFLVIIFAHVSYDISVHAFDKIVKKFINIRNRIICEIIMLQMLVLASPPLVHVFIFVFCSILIVSVLTDYPIHFVCVTVFCSILIVSVLTDYPIHFVCVTVFCSILIVQC
jgi:hypothetical protein